MWRKASSVNGKFVGGFASWNEIKGSWLTNTNYKEQFHEKTKSTFAFNDQEQIYLGYESPKSLKYKADYAADNNLGGLMVWAIDQDDADLTMMKIIGDAPLCKHTDPSSMFYKCSPLKGEKRWWTLEDSEERAGMCGRSAPLYTGYYPVCDPDDPGYSCCSPEGYCGKSDKHCTGLGINYEENPNLLVNEPVRPSINPPLWYLLDAPDGKRGRCGPDVPPVSGNIFPICNPDDKNAHCCSNGGYCGTGDTFCSCDGCIDFKKDPSYRFKSKH
jgi:chitinase